MSYFTPLVLTIKGLGDKIHIELFHIMDKGNECLDDGPSACYLCNRDGHWMWDCPKVNKAVALTNSIKDKMDRLKTMLDGIQEEAAFRLSIVKKK
jgi:hypothetical protein